MPNLAQRWQAKQEKTVTATEVMDMSRSLLNDQIGAVFTDEVQIPYLNMALRDLGTKLQLNDIPVSLETSEVIEVDADATEIEAADMPDGFINAKQLWQRETGTTNPFIEIKQFQFLPHWGAEDITAYISGWAYWGQLIHFIPSTTAMDVKIDFTKNIIVTITDGEDDIEINNSFQYLGFKTAAYCSFFIGENPTRAEALHGQAEVAFSEMLGIETKGQQAIVTRRRPFRAGWKQRGYI